MELQKVELQFEAFPKIPRWNREIIITEKLDGTNASVTITEDGQILAGSRNRFVKIGDDNYGFAAWVEANKAELMKLGVGRHFGEWWGQGIQRGYGLKEKRFSLFNTLKWADPTIRPACCHVTPVLYQGPLSEQAIQAALHELKLYGSKAFTFMDPEGIIIFHKASGNLFKITCENDAQGKGEVAR
jgi:hypothetical protein